jgi:hypothetical protein
MYPVVGQIVKLLLYLDGTLSTPRDKSLLLTCLCLPWLCSLQQPPSGHHHHVQSSCNVAQRRGLTWAAGLFAEHQATVAAWHFMHMVCCLGTSSTWLLPGAFYAHGGCLEDTVRMVAAWVSHLHWCWGHSILSLHAAA